MSRRGSKYGAVKTEVDGILFASKAEARRYAELRLLEKAGKIRTIELQPAYELLAWPSNGTRTRAVVGRYVADFRYERFLWPGQSKECETVVEDVKGFKTPLYRWKKKHVEKQYGITVQEITSR